MRTDDKESPSLPPVITDHELLRSVAAGSYGEVWLARCALGTYRAVKIVRRATFRDNPRPYEREFAGLKRFEPISREHEGLVDILQVGRDDKAGFFYYVMELADNAAEQSVAVPTRRSNGKASDPRPPIQQTSNPSLRDLDSYEPRTLAHEVKVRGPLPTNEVIQLAIVLAEGLQFLHSKGLVHRDIKPSNIIFVNGVPKLADVGLVANLDEKRSLAGGTIGFMPPEGPGTVQADIYSLGKVIYEAATGKDRQEFPELPTHLDVGVGDSKLLELNEVWNRACAGQPEKRYLTAAEMLGELKLLQRGDSLRLARARRQRTRRAGVVAGLILGIAVMAGSVWALRHARLVEPQPPEPKVLFSDDFHSPKIDTKKWVWATNVWYEPGHTGHGQSYVAPTNGEMLIEATAQHEGGQSMFCAAWLDSKHDFRKDDDCHVEIELSGTNQFGESVLSISDGQAPLVAEDPRAVRLPLMPADKDTPIWNAPAPLAHGKVGIDLLPSHQAAVVYPDAKDEANFEVVNLASLAQWRLRFYALANSSRDCPRGMAMFRLRKITVFKKPAPRTLVGHVLNAVTELPLREAVIKDHNGNGYGPCWRSGAFKLTVDGWPERITVENHAFVSCNLVVSSEERRRGPVLIELSKRSPAVGDVLEVIRYTNFALHSIGFRGADLWALVIEGRGASSESVLHQVDLDLKQLLLPTQRFPTGEQPLISFAQCVSNLLATSAWRARIYDVTSGNLAHVLDLRAPLNIPSPGAYGHQITTPRACAYDGEFLWFVEDDAPTSWFGLHALDLTSGTIKHSSTNADTKVLGLAWDADRRQFWLSNRGGKFYAVNRAAALSEGIKESDRGREFDGNYVSLAFGAGYLWGLDTAKKQICKIKIRD